MITITQKIHAFVEALAQAQTTKDAFNQYSYERKENIIRRENLVRYLQSLFEMKPAILLVGEAPGYRGMRRTGLPFTSEKTILTHSFFTSRQGFNIEHTQAPVSEASATIVWKAIDEWQTYPLMWASFPFHPHMPNKEESNRMPTKEERHMGKYFLSSLIDLVHVQTIAAVGRTAEKILAELHIPAIPIRHPSHGGALLFRNGFKKLIEK